MSWSCRNKWNWQTGDTCCSYWFENKAVEPFHQKHLKYIHLICSIGCKMFFFFFYKYCICVENAKRCACSYIYVFKSLFKLCFSSLHGHFYILKCMKIWNLLHENVISFLQCARSYPKEFWEFWAHLTVRHPAPSSAISVERRRLGLVCYVIPTLHGTFIICVFGCHAVMFAC